MLKKMLVVAVIAGAAVFAVKSARNGRLHIPAKVEAGMAKLQDWAEGNDSVERKIAQLRKDAEYLDKDMYKLIDQLSEIRVDVRRLQKQATEQRAAVAAEHKALVARGEALRDGTEKVSIRDAAALAEAKEALKRDVTRHLDAKRTLEATERTLASKEKSQGLVESQLATLKAKKGEVKARIDEAEAKMHALKLAQMESKYQRDNTRLAKIKAELDALDRMLDIGGERLKLAPLAASTGDKATGAGESVEEIMAPLAGEKKPAGDTAAGNAIE